MADKSELFGENLQYFSDENLSGKYVFIREEDFGCILNDSLSWCVPKTGY